MKTTFLTTSGLALLAASLSAECGPAKNVSADEAAKLLGERKDIVVLDIRTEAEFKVGHIAGAKNIPFNALVNDDGTYKSEAELRKIFTEAGVGTMVTRN